MLYNIFDVVYILMGDVISYRNNGEIRNLVFIDLIFVDLILGFVFL